MSRMADTVLRIRDMVVPVVIGVFGPLGALATCSALLFDRVDGRPSFGMLLTAIVALTVGLLMLWTRWRLLSGRHSDGAVGALAVIHTIGGAILTRASLAETQEDLLLPFGAVYAFAMAALMAWCARVPIRPIRAGED